MANVLREVVSSVSFSEYFGFEVSETIVNHVHMFSLKDDTGVYNIPVSAGENFSHKLGKKDFFLSNRYEVLIFIYSMKISREFSKRYEINSAPRQFYELISEYYGSKEIPQKVRADYTSLYLTYAKLYSMFDSYFDTDEVPATIVCCIFKGAMVWNLEFLSGISSIHHITVIEVLAYRYGVYISDFAVSLLLDEADTMFKKLNRDLSGLNFTKAIP